MQLRLKQPSQPPLRPSPIPPLSPHFLPRWRTLWNHHLRFARCSQDISCLRSALFLCNRENVHDSTPGYASASAQKLKITSCNDLSFTVSSAMHASGMACRLSLRRSLMPYHFGSHPSHFHQSSEPITSGSFSHVVSGLSWYNAIYPPVK